MCSSLMLKILGLCVLGLYSPVEARKVDSHGPPCYCVYRHHRTRQVCRGGTMTFQGTLNVQPRYSCQSLSRLA